LAIAVGALSSAPALAATVGASATRGSAPTSSPTTGGSGLAGVPGSGGAVATPAEFPVSATGDGITVQTLESGLLRNRLTFTGTVPASDTGMVVEIERSASPTGGLWLPTAHATVTAGGAFSVVWRANRAGRFAIEAELVNSSATAASATHATRSATTGSGAALSAAATAAGPVSPPITIVVYRPSLATIYGPGFYGQQTACGQTLRRSTLGVASRTLKCGTKVSVLYQGRAIVVPVIDRGPYANGATWDLTMATAKALGITGTSTVGALPTI
jgi:rare lipoprotein A